MVQAKVIFVAAAALLAASCGPRFSWERYVMDGHRTGVIAPNAENVEQALGKFEQGVYTAPNGEVFTCGSTPAVAADMISVQTRMADLKAVIGTSAREMVAHRPESELSNWLVDNIMADVQRITGRKVDVGISNFGGIRVDMPQGDVILDDIVSMFPFKNYLCYVQLKGEDLLNIFQYFAKSRLEVVGGAKFVIKDRQIDTLLVGGAPIDPEKLYGVATIDFLLDGGDSLTVAKNAKDLIITDRLIVETMLASMNELTAAGQALDYPLDGRVVFKKEEQQ